MEEGELDFRVADYWQEGLGWKWKSITQKISLINTARLALTILRSDVEHEDLVGWLKPRASDFTVKKAYEIARGSEAEMVWPGWKLLWKEQIAHRVRVFSWIMSHDRLLTNKKRWIRRISTGPDCIRCNQGVEDAAHAVRDCRWAREVWVTIIPSEFHSIFFSLGLKEWVLWILGGEGDLVGAPRWSGRILTACWW